MELQTFVIETESLKTAMEALRFAMGAHFKDLSKVTLCHVGPADSFFRKIGLHRVPETALPFLAVTADEPSLWIDRYKKPRLRTETHDSLDRAVASIGEIVRSGNDDLHKQFAAACGDGYGPGFYPHDGSIETGYEVRLVDGWPRTFAISLCHIYYGN